MNWNAGTAAAGVVRCACILSLSTNWHPTLKPHSTRQRARKAITKRGNSVKLCKVNGPRLSSTEEQYTLWQASPSPHDCHRTPEVKRVAASTGCLSLMDWEDVLFENITVVDSLGQVRPFFQYQPCCQPSSSYSPRPQQWQLQNMKSAPTRIRTKLSSTTPKQWWHSQRPRTGGRSAQSTSLNGGGHRRTPRTCRLFLPTPTQSC